MSITCRGVQSAAKRQLVKDMAKLKIEELGFTVQMVWEICPDAVTVEHCSCDKSKQTKETIEVDADKISKYCYYVVKNYMSTLSPQTNTSFHFCFIQDSPSFPNHGMSTSLELS